MQDLREWLVPCQKIVKALSSNNAGAQKKAVENLKEIDDPSAVAALELACYELDEASTGPIIEAIAKFESPAACMALTRLALAGPETKRGELALAKLKDYPKDLYVPELLSLLSTPIETRVQYAVNGLGELQMRRAMFRTNSKERQLVEYNRLVRVNEPLVQVVNVREVASVGGAFRKQYTTPVLTPQHCLAREFEY